MRGLKGWVGTQTSVIHRIPYRFLCEETEYERQIKIYNKIAEETRKRFKPKIKLIKAKDRK